MVVIVAEPYNINGIRRMKGRISVEHFLNRYLTKPEQDLLPLVPENLFVQGYLGHIPDSQIKMIVAIVGTRNPSSEGIREAKRLTEHFVDKDYIIMSGLASGIDTVVHRTALDMGSVTFAVLGTPLNVFYPKSNARLQQYIMDHHLAISQFPEGSQVVPVNFIYRDYIMALLSDHVVVVESREGGGSLYAAWQAMALGNRMVSICDKVKGNEEKKWFRSMLKCGAKRI